ncbi:MAG TPA: O-methyltransferase [Demequinaceae bacterium]
MTHEALANWAYCEDFVPEDEVLRRARDVAEALGCVPVMPGAGAVLTAMALAIQARTVAEIGTGTGVSAVYLLRGMHADGILTSIDVEPESQKAARQTIAAAGFPPERVRMISGAALDVLPRLTDGGYDFVLIDAIKSEYPAYLEHALRIVRTGGVIAIDNALWHSKVADPAQRDHNTTAVRETLKAVRASEELTPVLLPSGDGLLIAIRR